MIAETTAGRLPYVGVGLYSFTAGHVTYLFDNNISFRFAHMLAALGVDAIAVRDVDLLGESATDRSILSWLMEREATLITGDRRIRFRPQEVEVEALRRSR